MPERVTINVERATVRVQDAPTVEVRLGTLPGGDPGGTAAAAVAAHEAEADPHPGYLPESATTAYTQTLLDDPDATAARATLGFADPSVQMQYVVLGEDQTESANTLTDLGLGFTPEANATYHVEFYAYYETPISTTGLQWTFEGPTGTDYGIFYGLVPSNAAGTTTTNRLGPLGSLVLGINNPVASPAWGWALFRTGASPSGDLKVQYRTEVAGSAVTVKAGAFIRYRRIA